MKKPRIPPAHRGAGLVVALVVMAVMSLGALALVRAVATGLLVASNAAFRQAAVDWLSQRADGVDLLSDQAAAGFYASLPTGLSLTGQRDANTSTYIDWDDDQCANQSATICQSASTALPQDAAGHQIRYVIHRLCRVAGSPDAAANSCLLFRSTQGGSSNRGQLSYCASKRSQTSDSAYYRITVRVRGPRNTTAFVQTLVHY